MAEIAVQAELWPDGHGNHHPTLGSMEDLTAASLSDVEAFWRRWYVPSNATIVICGGIDVVATKKLIQTYFGWMPAVDPPQPAALDEPVAPHPGAAALTATDRVQAAKVMIAWRTDAPYTDSAVDLSVAAQILGGGEASRLYQRLVFHDRLASEVDVYQDDQVLGGEFHVEATVREHVKPEKVTAAIEEELAAFRDGGPTKDEVERAQRVLEAGRLESLENIASRAEAIAQWAAETGDPDYLGRELDQLRGVSAEGVKGSARAWLAEDAAVTMTVTPEEKP
jgi:zinc protease